MSLITKMRKRKAVWWRRLGRDKFMNWSYAAPVEIDCRWDDITTEFVDPQGDTKISRSVVYVDRDMTPGDVLFFGTKTSDHDDYLGGAGKSPERFPNAYSIKQFSKIDNLKATEQLRTVYL